MQPDDDEELLRSVALRNANSILLARQRAEEELRIAKELLESKSEQLAQSLAMMRATLESTADGILVTDEHGTVTVFNEKFVQMWRLPRAVMDARRHDTILHAIRGQFKDATATIATIDSIYASSPAESLDVLELADGRVFERFSKIQYVADRNVGRVWSYRDITDRKQAEEALRDETRILELLNKTGTTIASTLDLQSLLQSITDAATQLSGAEIGAFFYTPRDGTGEALQLYTVSGGAREAFDGFMDLRAATLVAPIYKGAGPIRSDDLAIDPRYGTPASDGETPPAQLRVRSYLAVPVALRTGGVIGGLLFAHHEPGMFSERTQRIIVGVAAQAAVAIDNARLYESERAARADAERTSHMKDEFLATLSHELRTPINAVLGWSQLLRSRPMDPAELRRGLETIDRNARMQTQLIEDLLDMSRITSGTVRLDIQTVEPHLFIEAAIETVRPAAEAKNIRLEKLLDPAAGPIAGDPSRLQQVMWNLLFNAVKFTPRGGKIQILLQRVNSQIEISVADDGIGIEPDFLPHVFERFRQADASVTRSAGGLGLGLSIVKHLVELHGGTVRVDSRGHGAGTTFAVSLPITVVHRSAAASRLHPRGASTALPDFAHTDLAGIKVLVVDDELDARDLIEQVLNGCNAQVFTASCAADAVKLVESERPDLLVSDIGMPDVDGYELLRMVRALGRARGGRIPAIALTAFARSEDRTRALRAGFGVHLAKPVDPSELVATVASVAGRIGEPEADG